MKNIRRLKEWLFGKKWKRQKHRVLATMMAIVVFCTTYALILPAITLDSQTAETEPGVEAEVSEAETLGEVQNADLLLQGHPPEEAGTATLVAESEEGASEQTNAEVPVSEAETEKADTVSETKAAEAAGDTETETVKDYAASPLIYHCDSFDIELSFDSEEWKIPEGTVLIIKELQKEADQDSEEYRNYHYYDERAKEELSAQDEKLAARAYALHYYEIQLKAEGKEVPIPKGETDITIKYHFDDKSNNNEKEFRDEDSILASLFWHDKDETLLFDQNWDESDVITLKNNHLSKVYIKDLELADFENVIGLYACPPEKEVALKAEGSDYSVTAVCGKESGVPENAQLTVSEIRPDSEAYDQYLESAREAIGEETKSTLSTDFARFFDIKIMDDGEELTPDEEIEVKISFREPVDMEQMQTVNAVNFGEERAQVLDVTTEQNKNGIENVSFNAGSSSVTGIVGTVIEKTVLASDGKNYRITATYGAETDIPVDAELEVNEILPADIDESNLSSVYGMSYEEYVAYTENALGWETGSVSYARVFDIKIVDKDDHSVKHQPADGTSVNVRIELADSEGEELNVVHFVDESEVGDVVENSTENSGDGSVVEFAADGFSVYVVADKGPIRTYSFYSPDASGTYDKYYFLTDTGESVYQQKIKTVDGVTEELVIPQLPSIPGSTTSTFAGWYVYDPDTGTYADEPFDFSNIPDVTTEEEVVLRAKFADYAYVIFHEQYNGATRSWPVAETRRGEKTDGSTSIQISDVTVTYDDSEAEENSSPEMAFRGWSLTPVTAGAQVDVNGDPVQLVNDPITITENTDLYPVFVPL